MYKERIIKAKEECNKYQKKGTVRTTINCNSNDDNNNMPPSKNKMKPNESDNKNISTEPGIHSNQHNHQYTAFQSKKKAFKREMVPK
jgi:hypothetical protein